VQRYTLDDDILARLPERRTGPTLGDMQLRSHLLDAGTATRGATMIALIFLIFNLAAALFKSKSRLEAENAALRHQLIVLQRKVRALVPFTNSDRLFFVQLYRWFRQSSRA
jgi:hypothetical protein